MDYFTHILFGAVTFVVVVHPVNLAWIIFAAFMTGLPDFDVLLLPLSKIYPSYYFHHRGGSHSYITGIVVAALFAAIFWGITGESFFVAWFVGALFYNLHLTLDVLTTYKTPLFYPLVKKEYKYDFEQAINPALMFISLCVNLFLAFYPKTPSEFEIAATVIAIIYYGYLIYRIGAKLVVERNASPGTHFFPGMSPFHYYLLQQTTTTSGTEYRLSKHVSIFRKVTELLHLIIPANSTTSAWFELAKNSIPHGRLFGKWEFAIPFVEEYGDRVQVKMMFAETFIASGGFCIIVEFERNTRQVLGIRQKWERVKILPQLPLQIS